MLTAAFQDSDYSILNSFPSIKDSLRIGSSTEKEREALKTCDNEADELMLEHCTSVTLTLRGSGYYILVCWCPLGPTLYNTSYLYHFCNTPSPTFFRFGLQDKLMCIARISILMTFLIEKWLVLHFRVGLLCKLLKTFKCFETWKVQGLHKDKSVLGNYKFVMLSNFS